MAKKRWLAVTAATAMIALAACSSSTGSAGGTTSQNAATTPASSTATAAPSSTSAASSAPSSESAAAPSSSGPGMSEPSSASTAAAPTSVNTTVSGDITVLTNRTDLAQDGTLNKYAGEFKKLYPNVNVKFQGLTDYEGDVKIRMNSSNYGDVLLIPNALPEVGVPAVLHLAGGGERSECQVPVHRRRHGERPGLWNRPERQRQGLRLQQEGLGGCRRHDVAEDHGRVHRRPAGHQGKTRRPRYYTNYKDGWPLTQCESALGSVASDTDANNKLATDNAPWTSGKESTASTTCSTTWCKRPDRERPDHHQLGELQDAARNGKIATMWLGSWSISQMQAAATKAGASAADIGFMPLPAQVNGKFHSVIGGDYKNAVNTHSQHKDAARAWITWFTDASNYAVDQGSVPTADVRPMPVDAEPFTTPASSTSSSARTRRPR